MNRTNSLVIACALLSLVLLACNGAEETARQSEASPPPEATTVVAPAATRETLDTTKTTPTPGKPLPDDTTDPSTPSALSSDVSSSAPAEPTPTSPPSSEGADGAYLTCCVRVWDGFVAMLDAIATAGEAADTDVFCEAQMEWDSTVRELRASHAECPKPADSGLVHASSLLDSALEELEQATALYSEFCRTQNLNLADDANQQLQQAVSHAAQAYEALTGQPVAAFTPHDVNVAFVECFGDVLMDLWNLFDDIESAPEADNLMEFCAPVGGWATKLAGIQAKYDLCTTPTDPCLLATQQPLEASLADLGAAFQDYVEACALNDETLVEEGHRHLLDSLPYLDEAAEAMSQCGGE